MLIEARLATSVPSNPGPGIKRDKRGKGEESRRAQCENKQKQKLQTFKVSFITK